MRVTICALSVFAFACSPVAEPQERPIQVVSADATPTEATPAIEARQQPAEAPRPTCPTDDMPACLALAIESFPAGKHKDAATLERALALASAACERGHAPACTRLGSWINTTSGDARASYRAYFEACTLGDPLGCEFAAATLLRSTGEDIVPEVDDLEHAAALLTRACEANQCGACFELAGLYEQGRGVTKDRRMATKLAARSEELGCAE